MTKSQIGILIALSLIAILIFCVLGVVVYANLLLSSDKVSKHPSETAIPQTVKNTSTPTNTPKPTATRGPTATSTPKPLKLLDTFEGTGYDEFKVVILGPGQFYFEVESEYRVEMAMYGPVKRLTPCVHTATELRALFIKGGAKIEHEAPTYSSYPLGYCLVVAPFGITEMDYKTYSSIPWTVKFIGNVDY